MNLYDLKWSPSEKKIARSAYDAALESALTRITTEFKSKAAAVTTSTDMWKIEDYLRQKRREIGEIFDYRYSALIFVFARLIREGHLDENRLAGLSEEKRKMIHSFLE